MTLRDKILLSCQLVMAIPFVVLMLAGLFLAGTNLLVLFTGKPVVVQTDVCADTSRPCAPPLNKL